MASRGPKPGLTFERHVEIGADLQKIRDQVQRLYVEVANAYPRSERFARELRVALSRLDAAKASADTRVFADHPSQACTHVYYRHGLEESALDPSLPHACSTSTRRDEGVGTSRLGGWSG